ncbi:type VI secretion system-associated protein TagF [Variovorax robiniae]|uniref:Type VI secretion system-associated protein TagF n=1 Tax=Variovorax robiniae TaxID=1836199 RepID=A0ABU8XC26_9BURK
MSQVPLQAQQLSYFGKLPMRGDFVKGIYNPQLLRVLDNWLSQGMELLSEDPRWKLIYDDAAPLHFVCLGSRSRLAIAGHVRPSHDESSRRYPFLVAVPLDVDKAIDFMSGAPALLQPWWDLVSLRVTDLATSSDMEADLRSLEAVPFHIDTAFKGSAAHSAYHDFIRDYSLLRIEQTLNFDGHKVSLRRMTLALGLLLQPVMASTVSHLEKGLTLPLPRDPLLQPMVATFWLDIVARFFAKADFELVLCVSAVSGLPRLIIGFNGLSPRTLQSVLHLQVHAEQNIEIDNPDWVEESIHSNYAMYKLVSYLEQPQLPLEIVLSAFREVFIGD